MRHEMSLRPGPFEAIASGRKRYELRLNDEKRSMIRVGDEIVFTRTSDEATLNVCVTSLHPYGSFAELYASLPLLACGYTPENVANADPADMETYYPPEKQAQYGVLGIGIELIRLPLERLNGEYTVRLLTEADLPEMLRVAQSNPLFYQYMRPDPTLENLAESMQALPPRRTMPDKYFFGWFAGNQLIGIMDLITRHPRQDMAFIGWFILDAAWQGKGLGKRLAGDVLSLLAAEGFREVRLGRIKGNPQSEAFWHACGFKENGLSYDTEDYTVLVMSRTIA